MNWREKIDAQIAELRSNGVAMHFHAASTMQALLDVAVAADTHTKYLELSGLQVPERLERTLNKLREAE